MLGIIFLSSTKSLIGRTITTSAPCSKNMVLVDGVRTPFLKQSTDYKSLMPHDLQRMAMVGLLQRTGFDPSFIEYVCVTTIMQEVKTHNIARDAALVAGMSYHAPAYTLQMACIGSNQAITTCLGLMHSGLFDICLAGGVEFPSDLPIRHSRKMRQWMLDQEPIREIIFGAPQKAKTPAAMLSAVAKLRPNVFAPDFPSTI